MDSMIERVARVIAPEWWSDTIEDGRHLLDNYPGQHNKYRALSIKKARAVIAAMREPTEAMIAAGVEARCEHGESQCGAAYSWQEMIASALKEGE